MPDARPRRSPLLHADAKSARRNGDQFSFGKDSSGRIARGGARTISFFPHLLDNRRLVGQLYKHEGAYFAYEK